MPMTQEFVWLIFMPNSAMTMSQMHPLKKHKKKKHKKNNNTLSLGSGWGKKFVWSFEQNKSYINLNYVLNISAYMQNISSSIFFILESKHFTSENGILVLFCFPINNQISNRHSMHLSVRNMPHLIVQKKKKHATGKRRTQRLVIISQPKRAVFSHKKRWVVPTGK